MSHYKWILDAGHGGMVAGKYATAPGKMHVFEDGTEIYEGVNNRAIVNKLLILLDAAKIDYALVHDEHEDTPLATRVTRANNLHRKDPRCIYLSVHSDAMPEGFHGKGSGISVWTSVGQTPSDKVAELFCQTYVKQMPEHKFRKDTMDGDNDHESNFYVLRETICPALLTENLFFDNRPEAEFLMSKTGQEKIAEVLFKAIMLTEEAKPI